MVGVCPLDGDAIPMTIATRSRHDVYIHFNLKLALMPLTLHIVVKNARIV